MGWRGGRTIDGPALLKETGPFVLATRHPAPATRLYWTVITPVMFIATCGLQKYG